MKMGDPETLRAWPSPAILGFQTSGGQRFEHLAAKRDWHVLAILGGGFPGLGCVRLGSEGFFQENLHLRGLEAAHVDIKTVI